ncbi:hypothetical protein Ppa06_22160 [Planomonospora parontospora subsp. parontospora]|uniref:Diguanylate cyclase n=1 Tax=Planomonospora parontospora subsp. parontospora TaxID=97194 RepID=A0ABQ4H8F3_9ACTN|nr:diguanylate cyclase [Planomonospora parontospora]GII08418.1 hypothetical protein Ppa06_22160 [Planomonospora parontospora subsp. parontospora]
MLTLLFALSAVVACAIAVVGWRRRHVTPAVGTLAVVAAGIAVWSVMSCFGYVTGGSAAPVLRAAVGFLAVCVVTAGFYCLSLAAVDRTWRLPRRLALWLAIEPALVLAAVLSDPWHRLFLVVPDPARPYDELWLGPLFWAHTAYSYVLCNAAAARLARAWRRGPRAQRPLYGVTLLSTVPPAVANIISLLGLTDPMDVTPVGFCLTTVLVYWALARRSLHELVTVERTYVYEMISDVVMTLDSSGRALDLNPAAERLVRRLAPDLPAQLAGLPVLDLLHDVPLVDRARDASGTADRRGTAGADRPPAATGTPRRGQTAAALFPAGRTEANYTMTDAQGRTVDLDVRVSALRGGRDEPVGWVLVGRDVTALNTQRRALYEANDRLREQVTTIEAQRRALYEANDRLREQVTTIEALRADLAEQAVRDPLTGLYNRRHLMETLSHRMRLAAAGGTPLSVALLDIDHFKQINDRCGHGVGDQVLTWFADLVGSRIGVDDVVARYGGEEFVVLLAGATGEQAVERMEGIREQVAAGRPPTGGHRPAVTFSAGVAAFTGRQEPQELLHAADEALYAAKRQGRNRVLRAPVRREERKPGSGTAAA